MQLEDVVWKAIAGLTTAVAALSSVAVYQYKQGNADHKERVADLTTRCTNLEKLLGERDAALMRCQEQRLTDLRSQAAAADVLADAVAEIRNQRKGSS